MATAKRTTRRAPASRRDRTVESAGTGSAPAGVTFVFRPRLVLAWKDFQKDATRFKLPAAD